MAGSTPWARHRPLLGTWPRWAGRFGCTMAGAAMLLAAHQVPVRVVAVALLAAGIM
jgi:hypothetical protein